MQTYFERVLQTLRVDLGERSPKSVSNEFLNLRENISLHIKVEIWLLIIYDLGKVLEAHFVCIFKFLLERLPKLLL